MAEESTKPDELHADPPPADTAAVPPGPVDPGVPAPEAAALEAEAVSVAGRPTPQEPTASAETPHNNTLDQAELDALTAQLKQATGNQAAPAAAAAAQNVPSEAGNGADSAVQPPAIAEAVGDQTAADGPAVLGAAQVAASAADATEFAPPEIAADRPSPQTTGIDMLDDVELDVKIELGRTSMYIEDVLRLGVGAVVELDKLAGDPVDIYVNERLVARGEVLVLNDNFCVRINQIHSPVPELDNG